MRTDLRTAAVIAVEKFVEWTFGLCRIYSLSMKARIREFLHATPFRPFIIRMADGREYRIDHPDFVLAAASDIPQVTIEEPDGRQHYLSVLLISSIERASGLRENQTK